VTDLDRRDAARVEQAVTAIGQACGERLLAVALTGEAASVAYRPGKSSLSLAVVVDEVEARVLDAMRPLVRRWRGTNVATPLLLDPLYLETSRDVFPLEFLDLLDRHRLLAGRIDPFADITIARVHLRIELEEQLRGKMLHLWQIYLETHRESRLTHVLLHTLPHFYILLRGMLFLRDEDRPTAPRELVAAVETAYRISLPSFHDLEAVRGGLSTLPRSQRRAVFSRYLDEVRTLVRVIDAA
jgi:hypothetical protein